MPLSPKVEISGSHIHGHCWRAKEDIKTGEMIWKAGEYDIDPRFQHHADDIAKWPKEQQEKFFSLSYYIGGNVFSGPFTADGKEANEDVMREYYINHCCDGNSWYDTDKLLIASKEIKKGEEIYYDYALTETDPNWSMKCLCNKEACRGVVTGEDYKIKALQQKYGKHFMEHILKFIEDENKQ